MKITTLLLCLVLSATILTAQNYRIKYVSYSNATEAEKEKDAAAMEDMISESITIEGPDGEEEPAKLPLSVRKAMRKNMKGIMDPTIYSTLTITGTTSRYDQDSFVFDNPVLDNAQQAPYFEAYLYKDHRKKQLVSVAERDTLALAYMQDYRQKHEWQIDRSATKEVGSFTCYRATKTATNGQLITAWFTPRILVPDGPDLMAGLPGLILEYRWNNRVTKAVSVKRLAPDTAAITLPTIDRTYDTERALNEATQEIRQAAMRP